MAAKVAGSVGGFFFLEGKGWSGRASFLVRKSTASLLMNLFLEACTRRFQWERTKERRELMARARGGGEARVRKRRFRARKRDQLKDNVASQRRRLLGLEGRSAVWARKEEARERG